MMKWIFFISGFVLSVLILLPLLLKKKKQNLDIDQKNQEASIRAAELNEYINSLTEKKELIKNEVNNLSAQSANMIIQNQMMSAQFELDKKIAKETFDEQVQTLKDNLDLLKENTLKKYEEANAQYENEYLQVLSDFALIANKKAEEIGILETQIKELRSKAQAAIEENKRRYEESEKVNFYRMVLPKEDIDEIKHLRSITPYLRNSEPLNKVIWKVYYENPCSDMIGRVLGTDVKTGIYKITNLQNNMCYVGQCVDAASRWKQHIKRGIGAETPTKNKLYPAMLEFGVENFSFELIEECDKEALNEREQYWQEFYGAKEFGYSIK